MPFFFAALVLISSFLFLPTSAFAGAVLTYHGRILDADDRPVEAAAVTFRIRIYSPNPKKCLLYEESRTISMVNSNGIFVIPIGDGAGSRSATNDPGIPMEEIFSNNPNIELDRTAYPKLTCNTAGHTYRADSLDQRQLLLSFDDHSGVGEQELPITDIGFVPLAVNSYDAQKIGGTPSNSVVRLSSGTATPMTSVQYTELLNLITGASTQYSKSNQLNGSNIPALTAGQALTWNGSNWVGATAGGSGDITDVVAGTGLSGGGTSGSVTVNLSNVGTAGDYYKVTTDAQGRVTAGQGSLVAADIPNLPASKITSGTFADSLLAGISVDKILNGASKYFNYKPANTACANGEILKYDTTLNASAGGWKCATESGVGSESDPTVQAFAKNAPSTGLTVNGSNQLTVDVGTTANKVVSLDGSGKLPAIDGSQLTNLPAGANFSGSLVGDVTGTQGATVVARLNGLPVSSAVSGDDTKYLKYVHGSGWQPHFVKLSELRNGSGTASAFNAGIAGCTAAQTLTWSSVTDQMNCQAINGVPAANITGLGALATKGTASLTTDVSGVLPVANGGTGTNSVAQNLFFAGPTSSPGAPSFRAIASEDLPASAKYWDAATGGINYAGGKVGIGTSSPQVALDVRTPVATSAVHPYRAGIMASGEGTDVTGRISARTASSIEPPTFFAYRSRGTLAAPTAVQLNDSLGGLSASSYDGTTWTSGGVGGLINFLADENWSATNHGSSISFTTTATGSGGTTTEKMRITANGDVGIGTASPQARLDVYGNGSGTTVATTGATDSTTNARIGRGSVGINFGMLNSSVAYIQNRSLFDNSVNYGLSIQTNGGNVGIGTTTMPEKLTVNGNIKADTVRLTWLTKTAANTGETLTGSNYFLDVSGGAISLTLPATPAHGDSIKFVHAAGTMSTNNVTLVAGAGDTIVGDANLILDINNGSIEIIFFDPNDDGNGDWRIM